MKHLIWTALVLAACGGPSGPSVADLEAAQKEAHAFRPWTEFEAALPAGLGDAKVDGDAYSWSAAADGGKCKILTVNKMGDNIASAAITDGDCP